MSGLIDTIVRRRRASASSRLGPPEHLLQAYPVAVEDDAGPNAAEAAVAAEPVPVPQHEPEPEAELEPEPELEAAPEPDPEPAAELQPEPEPEPELQTEPELQPEPEPEPEPELQSEPEPEPVEDQPTTTFAAVGPPPVSTPTGPPTSRTAVRRRVRYLAAVREVQLRDLGGFLLELHRFGRERPDLVQSKLASAAATDAELRELHRSLDQDMPIGELRRPGIGGACERCGAIHGSLDRFCATCGASLNR